MTTPACWSWPVTDELRVLVAAYLATPVDQPMARARLWLRIDDSFANGRCGICGVRSRRMVEDHDHATGLTRGELCRRCNTMEAASRDPIFAMYRERYPYLILGIEEPYTGWGWTDGEPDGGPRVQAGERWRDNAMRGVL